MRKPKALGLTTGILAAIGMTMLTSPAQSQSSDQITLRVADSIPAQHFFTNITTKPFMKRVEERTDGAVKMEHYPAQQLGKAADMLSLTTSGVTDISLMVPSYITDKFPLTGVVGLPGNFNSSCAGAKALWPMVKKGGALFENEIQPNGVRVLYIIVQPPFATFTANKAIRSVDDFQGLKLRTTGAAMDMMLKKLGGVPVRMPAPDVHEALARGTIDGGILAHVSIKGYDLYNQIDYATQDAHYGSASLLYGISEKKFQELPANVQTALEETGKEITLEACDTIDTGVRESIGVMQDKGIEFISLPEEENAKLQKVLANVGKEWAKSVDDQGKPGTDTLNAFLDQLK
jgi:TRAP-type C4-dicarboxylate transport system substrate-binding protein